MENNKTPTKDQQAYEYAEKSMQDVYSEEWDSEYVKGLIESAFEDGYTAAEQSQWRRVEDELPEPDTVCLVFGYQDLDFDGRLTRYTMMAWYDGENFYDAYNDRKYSPQKWMAIPCPATNTEKK